MLTRFRMSNFLSFKNNTTIDVSMTGYKTLNDTNVYEDTLKGTLFVGANASGKTNIIRGLRVLLDLLFAERILNLNIYKCLFSDKDSFSLEYDFQFSKEKINYFIEYDVIEKSFIEKLKLNDNEVINRIGNTGQSKITENSEEKLYTDIKQDSLLLREIYFNTKFRNHKIFEQWFKFLLNSVYLDGYKDLIFSPGKLDLNLEQYLENQGVEYINEFFEIFNFNQRVEYSHKCSGNYTIMESGSEEKDIYFKREGVGEPVPFPMESLGNQKILKLLPPFFHVIKNGGMLIVDEFSSGLHNFLEELLVKYFMDNSMNSQLFLVTHSTNLLSNSLLRPDQIYAVDFKGINGSKVKRFSTEQPRLAQNIEKMYTSGVFGGVPQFENEKDRS